jgi:hypothetical protein
MKDYIDGAEAISLLFAIGYTFGVQRGRVRIVRRDEKTKSVVKSVVNETSQPTTIQPTNQPTSQKNKTSSAQGWGKESTKRRQVRNLFFSGLIFRSLVAAQGYQGELIGLNRAHADMAKSRKNVTSVRAAGFSGVIFTEFLLKTGKMS